MSESGAVPARDSLIGETQHLHLKFSGYILHASLTISATLPSYPTCARYPTLLSRPVRRYDFYE